MLPPFDDNGNLPVGVHTASIDEVLTRFGAGSPEREVEGEELADFIDWARKKGIFRVVLDGSFTTDRIEPNDVDVVILGAPDSGFGEDLPIRWRDAWPFVHILVAVDEQDFSEWATSILAFDRHSRTRGVVEILL